MTPGHRVMSPEQIALIEKVRALGIAIEGVLNEVKAAHAVQDETTMKAFERDASMRRVDAVVTAEPARWLAMARTDLQVGLMKLTRAVAQPGFF